MIAYKDDLSFRRVVNTPKRNMGQRRMAFLEDYAQKNGCLLYDALIRNLDNEIFKGTKAERFVKLIERFSSSYSGRPVSEVLSAILDESGYEAALRTEGSQERLDNLAELKQSVYDYETTCGEEVTLEHYLSHVALFTNTDAIEAGDKVKMMTVHAAKGLEFPYVFLIGMNEGIFPSRKVRTVEGMEEERRLAFVAMTRAEKRLFLTEADGRNIDGSPRYPSRFILNIDQELLEYTAPPREGLIRDSYGFIEAAEKSLVSGDGPEILSEGTRIEHPVFGPGTITGIDMDRSAYVIKFDRLRTTRTIAFRAKIRKL
jgi:DNA helicase-2/ATP-dependent DNA helicase PcrA